jgi:catechol 2,3-dioxygenase-like lactoylglutathione lyase family enzyme
MSRAIDHLVIPSRDLAAQADLYRRLGFQVGPRNRHPWGTENHIAQFDGAFLELIGLGERFAAPPSAPGEFSFAGFVAEFLARREGLAMLVLRSSDAEADRREFAAGGLGDFARFDFARKAARPDGGSVDVAFSLAFAHCGALPETGFFVCQQHFPENFWNRQAQVHPNGASAISGVVIVHDAPEEALDFLSAFVDAPPRTLEDGYALGSIECLTRVGLSRRFGVGGPSVERGLAAVRIGVADIAKTADSIAAGGMPFARRDGMLIVDGRDAMGALLVFEPRAARPNA